MPSMTKKDFVALAAAIKAATHPEGIVRSPTATTRDEVCTAIARAIADHCAQANGNFKRDRFFEACGVKS